MKINHLFKLVIIYFLVIVTLVILIFPYYWVFISSFKSTIEIATEEPRLIPRTFTLKHYEDLFGSVYKFHHYALNSLIVSLPVTIISILISTLAAYGLARGRIKGKRAFSNAVLLSYLTEPSMLVVPLFFIILLFGLYNNLIGLILTYPIVTIPFCIWMLREFFISIPIEIEEAALVDGASRLHVLTKIVLPLAAPGIFTAGIWSFVTAWNEFILALAFIAGLENWTLPLGLASYVAVYDIDWGLVSAACFLYELPALIVFAPLTKYFVKGLTLGAVKR